MTEKLKIGQWLKQLKHQNIPAFAETTRTLTALTRNRSANAADLAKVILQDSTLSSKVLRIVNSTQFNPTTKPIDTVSHAIVILGLDRIRNLAISASFFEDILQPGHLEQVHLQTIEAFHAAIHARRLAHKKHLEDAEQIYIAALFQRLGHILFWCFDHPDKITLIQKCAKRLPTEKEEMEALGFRLRNLTKTLIHQWHLTSLTVDSSTDSPDHLIAQDIIEQGFKIAAAVPNGWDALPLIACTKEYATVCKNNYEEAQAWIFEGVQDANRGLISLNVNEALLPQLPPPSLQAQEVAPIEEPTEELPIYSNASGLRLLMQLLNGPIDLDYIQLSLLECLKKSLQCPGVFILGRTGKSQKLIVKHYIGNKSVKIAKSLIQFIEKSHIPELERLMASHFPFFSSTKPEQTAYPESKYLGPHYLCFPLMSENECLGYLFAIRRPDMAISEEDFDLFCHFCEHGNIAFRLGYKSSLKDRYDRAQPD